MGTGGSRKEKYKHLISNNIAQVILNANYFKAQTPTNW